MSELLALVRPVAFLIRNLDVDGRIALLSALLAQEICSLPVGERDEELRRVQESLPSILDATEGGMRDALVANARLGE